MAGDLHLLQAPRATLAAPVLRALVRRPLDLIGVLGVVLAAAVIVVNALYLQQGPHPAPILAMNAQTNAPVETTGSLIMMPRPRPVEPDTAARDAPVAPRARAQIVTDVQRELARRGFYEGAVDGVYGPKMDAAIREFEQAANLKSTGEPTEALLVAIARSSAKTAERPLRSAPLVPPVPRGTEAARDAPAPSTRVAAVQRALADFGYGQIKPNGIFDSGTKSAIEKFERERKLPITGQISDRVTRELSAVTGRPLE